MLGNGLINRKFNFLRVLSMIDLQNLIEGGVNKQRGERKFS